MIKQLKGVSYGQFKRPMFPVGPLDSRVRVHAYVVADYLDPMVDTIMTAPLRNALRWPGKAVITVLEREYRKLQRMGPLAGLKGEMRCFLEILFDCDGPPPRDSAEAESLTPKVARLVYEANFADIARFFNQAHVRVYVA
jgi:hypothetical protein